MPSNRRLRAYGLLLFLVVTLTIYLHSGARQTQSSDFYSKTQEALQEKEYQEAAKERDAFTVAERLKAAEEAAKKAAEDKGAKYFDSVDGGSPSGKTGSGSVAGRVKLGGKEVDMKEEGGKKRERVQGVAHVGGKPRERDSKAENETVEDHEVEVELNAILKQSPIIIFSKSFCPHSALAKRILLDKYKILPAPYVVELDKHPLGARLQQTLAETTHRRTVPNVLIMGRSIGGGDDIEELDTTQKLIETVKKIGGSRITEVSLREGYVAPDL